MTTAADSRRAVDQPMLTGSIHSLNISRGGVPKLPQPSLQITFDRCVGDVQRDVRYHGGPARAVCIYSADLIEALRAEGHPIVPGAAGENVTIGGLDWSRIGPGTVLEAGDVVLEVTTATAPCRNIANAFADREFVRISEKVHPGWSRWYCRVRREGTLTVGMPIRIRTADEVAV